MLSCSSAGAPAALDEQRPADEFEDLYLGQPAQEHRQQDRQTSLDFEESAIWESQPVAAPAPAASAPEPARAVPAAPEPQRRPRPQSDPREAAGGFADDASLQFGDSPTAFEDSSGTASLQRPPRPAQQQQQQQQQQRQQFDPGHMEAADVSPTASVQSGGNSNNIFASAYSVSNFICEPSVVFVQETSIAMRCMSISRLICPLCPAVHQRTIIRSDSAHTPCSSSRHCRHTRTNVTGRSRQMCGSKRPACWASAPNGSATLPPKLQRC